MGHMMMPRPVLAALAVLFVSAPPMFAQDGAPVSRGVTSADLAERVQRLQVENADLRVSLNDLRAEVATLNGKVETLEFLLGQSRDEINRMQDDDRQIGELLSEAETRFDAMEARIAELEASLAAAAVASPLAGTGEDRAPADEVAPPAGPATTATIAQSATPSPAGDPPQTGSLGTISAADLPGEAGALFSEAKSRLLQFDYAGAEAAFRAFLDRFGDDPQAGEALYWLGEVLYQQEAYVDSGRAYTEMIQTYPDDPRAPDALVKLARSMRLVGETERACAALDALPQRYPDASSVTRNLAAVERTRSGCGA